MQVSTHDTLLVRKVSVDFAVIDKKFSQIEGNGRKFSHIEHCFKWLKFHFCELENSRLFAEFLVPIGGIIFSGL